MLLPRTPAGQIDTSDKIRLKKLEDHQYELERRLSDLEQQAVTVELFDRSADQQAAVALENTKMVLHNQEVTAQALYCLMI
jgi:hypothetical protein